MVAESRGEQHKPPSRPRKPWRSACHQARVVSWKRRRNRTCVAACSGSLPASCQAKPGLNRGLCAHATRWWGMPTSQLWDMAVLASCSRGAGFPELDSQRLLSPKYLRHVTRMDKFRVILCVGTDARQSLPSRRLAPFLSEALISLRPFSSSPRRVFASRTATFRRLGYGVSLMIELLQDLLASI